MLKWALIADRSRRKDTVGLQDKTVLSALNSHHDISLFSSHAKRAIALFLLLAICGCSARRCNRYRDGDIIFQTSKSRQSAAIQAATHSKFSHMGVLFQQEGNWYVYEAAGTVRSTALNQWIARGKGQHFAVMRLRSPETLATNQLKQLKDAGLKFRGKKYDQYFEWSDKKIYCSELVWKMYKAALNIELGKLSRLGSVDLKAPVVKQLLNERYGKNFPLQEKTISPSEIYNCNLLKLVDED